MKIIIVSGVSGAGKTVFIKMLEDLGFFCVDNLPVPLIGNFVSILKERKTLEDVAVVIDVREKDFLFNIENIINEIKGANRDIVIKVIFLDARDEALLRRYSETRRKHPVDTLNIKRGLEEERYFLKSIKNIADIIIDTTELTPFQLRKKAEEVALGRIEASRISIKVISFGYKYGIPNDADIIFDTRFIENPFYVHGLREKTGKEKEVIKFLESKKEAKIFIKKVKDILQFMLENFVKQDKHIVSIAFGCTGGRHRSVYFSEIIYNFLKNNYSDIVLVHRDINLQ